MFNSHIELINPGELDRGAGILGVGKLGNGMERPRFWDGKALETGMKMSLDFGKDFRPEFFGFWGYRGCIIGILERRPRRWEGVESLK